jgi:hypothetical protein
LQDQIQAVGVGIATGAIVASTSGLMFQPWEWKGEKVEPSFPLPLLAFLIALLFSAACSVGAWYWAKEGIKQGRFPFRDVKKRQSEKPKR